MMKKIDDIMITAARSVAEKNNFSQVAFSGSMLVYSDDQDITSDVVKSIDASK